MASFDHVIAISKTVESYVNDNYKNHLKSPPRLIYRDLMTNTFPENTNQRQSTQKIFIGSFKLRE